MRIQINKNYILTSDRNNFILEKKQEKKESNQSQEDSYKQIGFYSTLEHVFQDLFSITVRKSTATTFKELTNDIQKAKEEISQMFKDVLFSGAKKEKYEKGK